MTTQITNAKAKKVCGFGEKDGLPAIQYWRYGIAAKGEPRIVLSLQTFPTIALRDACFAERHLQS
jgi:hypothetical protein